MTKQERINEAIELARRLVHTSIEMGNPCAFAVTDIRGRIDVRPFGRTSIGKGIKIVHLEPIPKV